MSSCKFLMVAVCCAAISLRMFLCWANPPENSFDNHYEPISLILKTWQVPHKDACFQCFHPPVFYYSSALIARTLYSAGMHGLNVVKSLQLLNCLYGILAVIVTWLILQRFGLSPLSRLVGLSFVCFLPRDIFMSAIHANDCLSYLMVALSLLLLLVTIDRGLRLWSALLLGLVVTFAVFVKYTAFATIPMVALTLAWLACTKSGVPRLRAGTALAAALLPPLLMLGSYCAGNVRTYGKPLPWNDTAINTNLVHPRDEAAISFLSFTPWQYMQQPIIMPGQMHSFWTLIYCGMWLDTEPKFTYYTDKSPFWWPRYYAWLRGERAFPMTAIPLARPTRRLAQGLLALGFVPLAMLVAGLVLCILRIARNRRTPLNSGAVKLLPLLLLMGFNALGIILLTLKAPVYSSMKASYFLMSLPAYAVCIALAMQRIEKRAWLRAAVAAAFVLLAALSSAAVLRIAWALSADA